MVSLLMSCALAATVLSEESNRIENMALAPDIIPFSAYSRNSVYNRIDTALVGSLIIVNDALLVGLFFCLIAYKALKHHKAYRTSVLFGWRPLSLILACSYLVNVGEKARRSFSIRCLSC
jgi:hypothetical protein